MNSYKTLREEAFEANLEIPRRNLAIYTWGNVSAFDSAKGVFAIKPSGVAYDALTPESMMVLDLEGMVVEGGFDPSSDTETHRVLYREFANPDAGGEIQGITHTHSPYAVAWAQARLSIPVFGTTHADHGAEDIPCTNIMSAEAVSRDYELETGNLIVEAFRKTNKNPAHMPMVLVAGHGPFTWGKTASQSIYNAAVLEEVLQNSPFNPFPIRKHWERKHEPNAYYGQK